MTIFDLLGESPLAVIAICLVLGLLVGSFLNVVIYRLPVMMEREWKTQCEAILSSGPDPARATTDKPSESATQAPFNLAVPASRCPGCGHRIRAWENIPVISYLLLRGRCSECRTAISARYPLLELATGLTSASIAYLYGFTPETLTLLFLSWTLIALTMIDYDHQLLPDSLTLPLLWAGLIINSQGLFTSLESALWGAVFGYLSLWSVYQAFKLLTGKEGMGYGDFKLLAALGAWAGWEMLPLIIILSSFVGAVIGIALMLLQGRERNKPIPFGPFLAIAGGIAMVSGEQLTGIYWKLLS